MKLFVVLVFALSIPFWLLGSTIDWQLFPGVPIGALAIVAPSAAAIVCGYREGGSATVARLVKRLFDWRQIKAVWYAPILLLMPVAMVLEYLAMRLLHMPLPAPQFEWRSVPVLLAAFFLAACGEELGWSGYAIDRLQARQSALLAALILGVIWAAWHVVPLRQANRANDWIAWWCLATVALRVLHTWLYNNSGKSVFGAAVFHASTNVSWQLFPNHGSHYNPKLSAALLCGIAILVTVTFGPKRLTQTI